MSFNQRADRVGVGPSTPIPLCEVLPQVNAGAVVILRNCLQNNNSLSPILQEAHAVLAEEFGPARAAAIMSDGVQSLHRHANSTEFRDVSAHLRRRLMPPYMLAMKHIIRDTLAIPGDVFVEESYNTRIFAPQDAWGGRRESYEVLRQAHLPGKITLHGPHTDLWGYHPLNVVNVWTAIGPVRQSNGMSFWPALYGEIPEMGDWHVARKDQVLGRPFGIALNPGDALLFHIRHLHGSRINQTNETRFVCSGRFTVGPPQLFSKPWYSYMHVDGIPDRLGAVPPPCAEDRIHPAAPPATIDTSHRLPPVIHSPDDLRLNEVRPISATRCVARTTAGVFSFNRHCPHEGADLAAGYIHNGHIHCPWHDLAINLETGASPCHSLPTLAVEELPSLEPAAMRS